MISTTKLKQQLEQMLVDSQETHYETYRLCGFDHRGNAYKVYNGEKLANKIKGIINNLGYCSCGGHPMPSGSPTIGTYHIHCSHCAKVTCKEFLVYKAIQQWVEIKG